MSDVTTKTPSMYAVLSATDLLATVGATAVIPANANRAAVVLAEASRLARSGDRGRVLMMRPRGGSRSSRELTVVK